MMRYACVCSALLLALALSCGVHGAAQLESLQPPADSVLTVTASAGLVFPALPALNQVISAFNEDSRKVARELKARYGEGFSIQDGLLPVVGVPGFSAGLFFKPSPPIALGIGLEYVPVQQKGVTELLSSEGTVAFPVEFSAPATGVLGVVSVDSEGLVDTGRWSFQLAAGAGWYGTTVTWRKQIELTGFETFDLRDPVDRSAATSAWGISLSLAAKHRFATNALLDLCLAWRSLKFRGVPVDFISVGRPIDLDFSGIALTAGLELHF